MNSFFFLRGVVTALLCIWAEQPGLKNSQFDSLKRRLCSVAAETNSETTSMGVGIARLQHHGQQNMPLQHPEFRTPESSTNGAAA